MDINAEWLAYARSRDASSRYMLADAMALPLGDRSFAHVCSVTALCFLRIGEERLPKRCEICKDFAIGWVNRHSLLLLWLAKYRKKESDRQDEDWNYGGRTDRQCQRLAGFRS